MPQRRQARKSMIIIQCYARDMFKELWKYTGGHRLKGQDMSTAYLIWILKSKCYADKEMEGGKFVCRGNCLSKITKVGKNLVLWRNCIQNTVTGNTEGLVENEAWKETRVLLKDPVCHTELLGIFYLKGTNERFSAEELHSHFCLIKKQ